MSKTATLTLRESAKAAMLAELSNVEKYSHQANHKKLHIYRDGSVAWFEAINESDDLIDRDADQFAAIPSVVTVGTGSVDCDCAECSMVYDEEDERLAIEDEREYDKSATWASKEEAIKAAVKNADLSAYEPELLKTFNSLPVAYFADEDGKI